MDGATNRCHSVDCLEVRGRVLMVKIPMYLVTLGEDESMFDKAVF
jgi:hypothetical protein